MIPDPPGKWKAPWKHEKHYEKTKIKQLCLALIRIVSYRIVSLPTALAMKVMKSVVSGRLLQF